MHSVHAIVDALKSFALMQITWQSEFLFCWNFELLYSLLIGLKMFAGVLFFSRADQTQKPIVPTMAVDVIICAPCHCIYLSI